MVRAGLEPATSGFKVHAASSMINQIMVHVQYIKGTNESVITVDSIVPLLMHYD